MAKREARIPVTASSGNVFADLGFDNPEEKLTKAKLAGLIWDEIERRGLTQTAAADLMGIDQPKVSALMNGRLANFSSERLMRLLNALGQDVDITTKPSSQARGRISVIGWQPRISFPPRLAARPSTPGKKVAASLKPSRRVLGRRTTLGSGSRSQRKKGVK
jgi:predicted XRE-type DNA-binding protein